MPTGRRRLARGVFEDAWGISVVYSRGGVPVETRFDPGTPLSRLIRWRTRQLGLLADVDSPPARGSLARAIVTYLKRVKGRPSYRSEKAHLRAWLKTVGNVQRWALTPQKAAEAVATWQAAKVAARTIHHRCRLLAALSHALDGPRAPTPVDDLALPAKPKPRPVSVADAVINSVATKLTTQERDGRLRDAKTRARFLVLAAHAQRPAELKRTIPGDVDLERCLWFVRGAKGGYSVIVPLNADQVQAWQFFIQAKAWGHYDTRSFARTLRTAGWPKTIRPYNLRHSTGFALSARGVDLGDIQGLLGHTSPSTTRIYVSPQLARLTIATKVLEGRLTAQAFVAVPRKTSTKRKGREAKAREKTSKSGAVTARPRSRTRPPRSKNTA